MLEQMIYMCEKCGFKSSDKQVVENCEQQHREIQKIMRCTEFEVTEQHLKLLQNQNVKFQPSCEYGSTEIDPKRPYGNSYVEGDVLEILGRNGDVEESDGCYSCSPKLRKELYLLHVETTIALQICMHLMKFETGKYIRKPDWIVGKWEKVS